MSNTYAIVVVAQLEPVEAAAFERAHGIEARAVVAHVRMAATLVDVHARVTSCREGVPVVANALKTSIQIRTLAVPANRFSFVTLVDVLNIFRV